MLQRELGDDEPEVGTGKHTVAFTLFGPLPGIEYSRRVVPHLELTIGYNGLGVVALTPSLGMRVRPWEHARVSPYAYGRAAYMLNPGVTDLQLAGGGVGVEWRRSEHMIVFVQAGASAARNVDNEDGERFVGDWSVVPDAMAGIGWRF